MMNALFLIFSIIGLVSIDLSVIGTKGGYINRTFKDLPLNIIKNNVVTNLVDEKVESYFSKETLELDVENYLNINLKNQVNHYQISYYYYFFNKQTISYDTSNKPKNVQIHFVCEFYKAFTINQYLDFQIVKLWS
ncbi:MAG: hypothetical protein SO087_03215 [Candidatus Onthovivens sp.]|nr:hypothetical protein [Candidatus Onthovivens sp.]